VVLTEFPMMLRSCGHGAQQCCARTFWARVVRLVDPVVGAAGWVLFVFVDVDLEALFVALVFPIADGVADAVEERAATEIDVGDEHAAEMADVCDVVSPATESGEKFDGAHDGDVGTHGDRDGKRDEPDFAVGEKHRIGHEDTEDCAAGADGGSEGEFAAEEKKGYRFDDQLDHAGADSADEKEIQEAALAPAEFEIAAEHPQHEHVDEDVEERARVVKKNIGEGLPDARRDVMDDGFGDEREPFQNFGVELAVIEEVGEDFDDVDRREDDDEEFYAGGDKAAPVEADAADATIGAIGETRAHDVSLRGRNRVVKERAVQMFDEGMEGNWKLEN
jgi:hypothetical protein